MRQRRICILVVLLAGAAQAGVVCDNDPQNVDAALQLRTGGFVETDFNLSQINDKKHSISFRFMLQYPNSYYNNMIGESGSGIYTISKETSQSGGCNDTPALSVNLGGAGGVFTNVGDLATGFVANRWYHIAVTVDESLVLRLYVDGLLSIRRDAFLQTSLQLPNSSWAIGLYGSDAGITA